MSLRLCKECPMPDIYFSDMWRICCMNSVVAICRISYVGYSMQEFIFWQPGTLGEYSGH